MKKCFPVVISILCLAYHSWPQSSTTEVIWGIDKSCSTLNSEEVRSAAPECLQNQTQNGTFQVIKYKNLSLAILVNIFKPYVRTTVQIANQSDVGLSFEPTHSEALTFATEQQFRSRVINNNRLAVITGEKAFALFKQSLGVPIGAERQGSTPSSPVLNQRVQTVDVTTANKTIAPSANSGQRGPTIFQPSTPGPSGTVSGVSKAKNSVWDLALKSQTIQPQTKLAGYIFFEPLKKVSKFLIVKINVDNIVFAFAQAVDPTVLAEERNK